MEDEWNMLKVGGKQSYVLKENIKLLRNNLNKEVFGLLDLKIEDAVKKFNMLD